MGENRDDDSGKRKVKGVVCPETEEIKKADGSLI
jgi:hypothetical protein